MLDRTGFLALFLVKAPAQGEQRNGGEVLWMGVLCCVFRGEGAAEASVKKGFFS